MSCPKPHTFQTEPLAPPTDEFERLLNELMSEHRRLREWGLALVRENSRLQTTSRPNTRKSTYKSEDDLPTNPQKLVCLSGPPMGLATPQSLTQSLNHSLNTSQCQECVRKPGTLADQFTRIAGNKHRIYAVDLKPVLEDAGETVDTANLEEVLRLCGASQTREPTMESDEDYGIDVHAWRELLEETNSFSNLSTDCRRTIQSVRSACLVEQTKQALMMVSSRTEDDNAAPAKSASDVNEAMRKKKQARRRAFWLEGIPTFVIVVNAIVTGLTVDHTGPPWDDVWEVTEVMFFVFYACEFLAKIKVYGCKGYFKGPDRLWNNFDFFCLAISLPEMVSKIVVAFLQKGDLELGPLLLIKIFRLTRLARPLRTLRFKIFYELKLIVMGVFSGLRVLFWSIVLLTVLTYLVGVAATLLFKEEEPEFASVIQSMFTLFRCWTDGCETYGGTPLPERLRERHGVIFIICYVLVTTFVTIGVFNLIMAIFIDNVVTAQAMRRHTELGARTHEIELKIKKLITRLIKETAHRKSGTSSFHRTLSAATKDQLGSLEVPDTMASIQREWDILQEKGVMISREVLSMWFKDEDFQWLLEQAEIESSNTSELFDVLDADMGGSLSLDELVTGLMKLRGPVTKADIVAVRLKVRNLTRILEGNVVADEG